MTDTTNDLFTAAITASGDRQNDVRSILNTARRYVGEVADTISAVGSAGSVWDHIAYLDGLETAAVLITPPAAHHLLSACFDRMTDQLQRPPET